MSAPLVVPPAHMPQSKTGRYNSLVVAGVIVLFGLCARAPQILTGGRVWTEEGAFLLTGLTRTSWQSLTWTAAQGYYQLPLSLGGTIAGLLPLEAAPIVFAMLSAGIFLLPLFVASGDERWRKGHGLIALALVLLATPPGTEVWLNVASAQFVLAVSAGLVLALEFSGRRRVVFNCVVLIAAGLAGMASVLLAPLFWLRALTSRTTERWLYAVVLTLIGVLQVVLLQNAGPTLARDRPNTPWMIGGIVMSRQILQWTCYPMDQFPFAPLNGASAMWGLANRARESGITLQKVALSILPALIYLAPLPGLWRRHRQAFWMLTAAAVLLLGSLGGSLSSPLSLILPWNACRYFYAPNLLLGLTLFAVASEVVNPRRKKVMFAVLGLLLALGFLEFHRADDFFFAKCDWYEQVERWHADPTRPLIHAPNWELHVPPEVAGGH